MNNKWEKWWVPNDPWCKHKRYSNWNTSIWKLYKSKLSRVHKSIIRLGCTGSIAVYLFTSMCVFFFFWWISDCRRDKAFKLAFKLHCTMTSLLPCKPCWKRRKVTERKKSVSSLRYNTSSSTTAGPLDERMETNLCLNNFFWTLLSWKRMIWNPYLSI